MVAQRSQLKSLYESHAPELLRFLRRRAHDTAEAEDLLQETFVQAAQHESRLAEAASPRAWLYAVARNVAGSIRRRVLRFRRHALADDLVARDQAEADPRVEQMRRAIGRLAQPLRETLELRLNADLSYAEIAEALEIPVGTVRSRLSNAVQQLTDLMHAHAEDQTP